jgi:hypothetical protein
MRTTLTRATPCWLRFGERPTCTRDSLCRLFAALLLVLPAALAGCGYLGAPYTKHIQEFPWPWETIDPGKPPDKFPRVEILEQGGGATVEEGDLIQLRLKFWLAREESWMDFGDWWLWIGFESNENTAFFSSQPDVARAVLNLPQGTSLRLLEGKQIVKRVDGGQKVVGSEQLKLYRNPLGDSNTYLWRKDAIDSIGLNPPFDLGYDALEIIRVCKGPAQYRTVHLYDDSPVKVCRGFGCSVSKEPRETWIDEARIDATCQDGRKVAFQYGPVSSRAGKDGRTSVQGYFDSWYREAWRNIPLGVQFVGDTPPVAVNNGFANEDGPLRIPSSQ